jgi:hypothetical protein
MKDYPKMLQTKFGDHPLISSVGKDVFLILAAPKRGESN